MAKGIETKKAIFDAAVALVRERGFYETSIVDICEKCGITKPTFYYYYSDKEAIFLDLTFRNHIDLSMMPLILRAENPWQQLWILTKSSIDQFALEYGKEILQAAIISNMQKGKNPFAILNDEQIEVSTPFVKRAQELKIVRSDYPARALLEKANLLYIGTLYMWAMNSLDTDIYEVIYENNKVIFDVDPKYDFPIEMYK